MAEGEGLCSTPLVPKYLLEWAVAQADQATHPILLLEEHEPALVRVGEGELRIKGREGRSGAKDSPASSQTQRDSAICSPGEGDKGKMCA